MTSTSEKLEILEDRIHLLAVKITQLTEENQNLKEELFNLKQRNGSLAEEIEELRREKENFEITKESVREKIERLIDQLSFGDQGEEPTEAIALNAKRDNGSQLSYEEAEALNKPFSDELLSETAINFFPEEDA